MIDATIVIPTLRHAALLPYALRSALDQEGASVEVFVVGDGVEDDTRAALEPFRDDVRVRFFDFPKGERHGELHRHEALREATRRIVCYLSDDDLLLRDHVAEMALLLDDADFAHSVSARLAVDGTLEYFPWNFSRPEFVEVGLGRKASIGLTGTAHTLEAYRRLPHGWRTTPPGGPNRPLHVAAMARAARVPRCDERSAHVPDLSRSMVGTAPSGGPNRSARRLVQSLAPARLRGGAGRLAPGGDPARC